MSSLQPLLRASNICLSFAGVHALTDVSFDVLEGEIVAIIGPNGAGKSSMLNVISGLYRPHRGLIRFAGSAFSHVPVEGAAARGIARTFQNLALFKGMTVLENVLTGRVSKTRVGLLANALGFGSARREEAIQRGHIESILELLELESVRGAVVGKLPYGLQKRVELGRALAAEPKLLLLDEPMAGMNRAEKQDMSRFILDANRGLGTTVVLIEHDMGVVMGISDRVVVLDFGRKIAEGDPESVRADSSVIRAYLGAVHSSAA